MFSFDTDTLYTMLPVLLATCCLCCARCVISLRLYILESPDKGIDPALERLTDNEYKVFSQGVVYINVVHSEQYIYKPPPTYPFAMIFMFMRLELS